MFEQLAQMAGKFSGGGVRQKQMPGGMQMPVQSQMPVDAPVPDSWWDQFGGKAKVDAERGTGPQYDGSGINPGGMYGGGPFGRLPMRSEVQPETAQLNDSPLQREMLMRLLSGDRTGISQLLGTRR